MIKLGTGNHLPWQVRWAARRFGRFRAEYYDYVAVCLEAHNRHRSLLDFFQVDASRRMGSNCRAVLAQWWAHRYFMTGANLTETLKGTLPDSEVACMSLAQQAGQDALVRMLHSLSWQVGQMTATQRVFWETVATGVLAMLVALASALWLPVYTSARLLKAFAMVPATQYGMATRAMMSWVNVVSFWWWLLLALVLIAAVWVRWSLPNWVSDMRTRFDSFGIWRVWKETQAVEVLALTAALIQTLGRQGASLRSIIQMQAGLANPYRQSHLQRVIIALDRGAEPIDAFDTGLISKETWWRLQDIVNGYGLYAGFAQASDKILGVLDRRIRRQAVIGRYWLLGTAVTMVLLMGYWHVCVIEELRHALLMGVW